MIHICGRNGKRFAAGLGILIAVLVVVGGASAATRIEAGSPGAFAAGSASVNNPYLPISKFRRCVLSGQDTGQRLRVMRVLERRKRSIYFGGQKVRVAVVKDRVTNLQSGELIEQTIDFFAQDRAGNAYYFGEYVSDYKNGKVVGHPGTWRVGIHGARPGLLMPAHPKVGDIFSSENVPGIAVERDRVIASGLTRRIDGHAYRRVIQIHEHAITPKPAEVELKTYAPGTGVITEANGELHLVGCT